MPDYSIEERLIAKGYQNIAGVDEVGRGPLAGPVVTAAVILDRNNIPEGLNDSKKLSAKNAKHFMTGFCVRHWPYPFAACRQVKLIAQISGKQLLKP